MLTSGGSGPSQTKEHSPAHMERKQCKRNMEGLLEPEAIDVQEGGGVGILLRLQEREMGEEMLP